ncbi:hypothetical protein Tco_1112581 [Tanacetum coccineum]|uniref:Uncharacterized protein n=1 Tax=Tanacetum coccineum TaxID=301880 RepID=A0ABQ5IPT9_9ASTR
MVESCGFKDRWLGQRFLLCGRDKYNSVMEHIFESDGNQSDSNEFLMYTPRKRIIASRDVRLMSSKVKDRVFTEVDGTFSVTKDRNIAKSYVIIYKVDFFDLWKLGLPLDTVAKLMLRRNFSALLCRKADSDDSSFHNEMYYGINFASDYAVTLVMTILALITLRHNLCEVTAQAKEIKALKAQVKKLKKGVKPLITHHKSWMKSVALKTRLARKTSLKKKGVQKGYVSKQGRKSIKSFKGEPSVHKDPAFDDLDDIVDDAMDYMESEDAQDEGGQALCTDKRNEGTDKQDGAPTTTSTPTPTIFGDDGTIAQVLITMSQNKQKEKEKGVEIRNVEDTERPRPTSTRSILTLRPLPKFDPKDKGKKRIEKEDKSDTESEDITEAEKKFKQLTNDEEVARQVQEEWEAEEERKGWLRKKLQRLHSLMNMISFRQDLMLTRYLLKSFKRRERDIKKMIKEMNKQAANRFSTKIVKKGDMSKGKLKKKKELEKEKLGKQEEDEV